ncbi:hydrogen-transporting atp synthase [Stylonychia lemnae]|uniref:Hydrogen-transporting atp synthase n=1 Tax=Stylonychia lemnae TaxID=5949 RepID=A0A078AK58_STYLE|nr:hydrogen-transporting atp synthase [Stylonychia lemnae]|eukprot:CDW82281.1 hydrogen-transporting atp synthase [Stylonychia lemnae]
MGVDQTAFGPITGIYVAVAAVAAPLIAMYVFRKTKDVTMKKDNCWMTFWLVLLGVFCMWIMWACTFMHQMYPLSRAVSKKPEFRVRCPAKYCNDDQDPDIWIEKAPESKL